MKRFFQIIILGILYCALYGCSSLNSEETWQIEYKNSKEIYSAIKKTNKDYSVSEMEAKCFAKIIRPEKQVQSISLIEHEDQVVSYVVNYDNGWIIISGDKRTDIVLASSNEGNIDYCTLDNKLFKFWIEMCAAGIYQIRLNGIDESLVNKTSLMVWDSVKDALFLLPEKRSTHMTKSGDPEGAVWVRRIVSTVFSDSTITCYGPFLDTKWGQGYPWNYNYPTEMDTCGIVHTCPVGCTAVAMAQVINYMHHNAGTPTGLYHGTYVTGDSTNPTFFRGTFNDPSSRWEEFARNKNGATALVDSIKFVREFMADVGNRVGMTYHWNGSGAWPSNQAMSYYGLGFSEMTHSDYLSPNYIASNLKSSIPVIVVCMYYNNQNEPTGHTWVIDGLKIIHYKVTYTYQWFYEPNNGIDGDDYRVFTQEEAEAYFSEPDDLYDGAYSIMTTWDSDYMYKFNWGWDGLNDSGEYATTPFGWYTRPYQTSYYYNIHAL